MMEGSGRLGNFSDFPLPHCLSSRDFFFLIKISVVVFFSSEHGEWRLGHRCSLLIIRWFCLGFQGLDSPSNFCTNVCFLEACDNFTGFKRRACGLCSWKRQVQSVQCVGREQMDMDLDSCSGSDLIRHWAISWLSEANSFPVDGSGHGLFPEMCLGPCALLFLCIVSMGGYFEHHYIW